jgi:hypothetical protein
MYDLAALGASNRNQIHFIVETAWVSPSPSQDIQNSSSNGNRKDFKKSNFDPIFDQLQTINAGVESEFVVSRKWLLTPRAWAVPSYDLVWGAGHSYG